MHASGPLDVLKTSAAAAGYRLNGRRSAVRISLGRTFLCLNSPATARPVSLGPFTMPSGPSDRRLSIAAAAALLLAVGRAPALAADGEPAELGRLRRAVVEARE